MKAADRCYVLTDKHFYRLDAATFSPGKKAPMTINQIASLSLFPGNDQGLIIHTKVLCVCVCVSVSVCVRAHLI